MSGFQRRTGRSAGFGTARSERRLLQEYSQPIEKGNTMAGDNSYKPGEIVKVSGIYSVVHDDGKDTFEVTCVEGEHFPPTRSGKGAHFELKYAATHSHRHDQLKGTEGRS
jgi:hypothetical protein